MEQADLKIRFVNVLFMIKWINGLTVATLSAFRLEDIECEKYQLVFASAKNVLVRPLFYVDKNNTNNLPFVISQI